MPDSRSVKTSRKEVQRVTLTAVKREIEIVRNLRGCFLRLKKLWQMRI